MLIALFSCLFLVENRMEDARQIAAWLSLSEIKTDHGLTWKPSLDPSQSEPSIGLYHGSPGPVLFYLALYTRSGDKQYLTKAEAGMAHLLAVMPEKFEQYDASLYTGYGGIGWLSEELYAVTKKEDYRRATLAIVAKTEGAPSNSCNDIIAGLAGTGLFLLDAHRRTGSEQALRIAISYGKLLLETAMRTEHGMEWDMDPSVPQIMPNFSHGTAGIAFFLARLGEKTGKNSFTEAATSGAEQLLVLSNENGLIYHFRPDGTDRYYLGWCHGPAGTSRLYHQLASQTEEKRWRTAFDANLGGVLKSGIPETRTPGFWNNVSVCCGSAGVALTMLDAFDATQKKAYLEMSRKMTEDLSQRATRDDRGTRWTQAEHRVKPEQLIAHTGFMQGASGIGYWLLRLDAHEKGEPFPHRLPDEPTR